MKFNLIKVVALLVVLLAAVSCARKLDGVQVGNGMKSYVSQHGYAFAYHEALSITEENGGRRVRLDNARLGASTVSALVVDVLHEVKIATRQDLELFARGDSRKEIQRANVVGGEAVEARVVSEGTLEVIRYLLMPGGFVVKMALKAFAVGQGITLLTPVLDDTRIDNTPPRIVAVSWGQSELVAGRTAQLLVEVEEDQSGIGEGGASLYEIDNSGLGLDNAVKYRTSGKWKPTTKKNVYALDFPISQWAKPGIYLPSLYLADGAGNSAGYGFDPDHFGDRKHNLSLQGRVELVNPGKADVQGPIVHEVQFPTEVTPGKMWTIRFRATDEVSGIRTGSLDREKEFFLGNVSMYINNSRAEKEISLLANATQVVREGLSDWYQMHLYASRYTTPGVEIMRWLTIYDAAGNRATVHRSNDQANFTADGRGLRVKAGAAVGFQTKVTDVGRAELPRVKSVYLSPSVKAGEPISLVVEFEQEYLDPTLDATVGLKPVERGSLMKEAKSQYLQTARVGALGKRQVTFRLNTHQWMAPGLYGVDTIWSSHSVGLSVLAERGQLDVPTNWVEVK